MDRQRSEAYRLAYDEAVRALSSQQAALETFQSRAGLLLSGAAVATSFLGGEALRDGAVTVWTWMAILGFTVIGTSAVAVLWPWRDWEFVAGPRRLVATYVEVDQPLPLPQIHRDLALHMEDSYDENEIRLRRLVDLCRLAALGLGVEVVAWIVDLATG